MYSINFTVTKNKFCLSLHYNQANSYLFVNGTEIYKFKAKDSEIVATPFQKTGQQIIWKKLNLMSMFMISVLTMMLLMLRHIWQSQIFDEKKT